jgi:hypothetical protein
MISETKAELPPDWCVTEAAGGGADLRVNASRSAYLIVFVSILAVLAAWETATVWHVLPKQNIAPWSAITLFLCALTLWIGFAGEVWHLEKNCVLHRVGIGAFCYSSRYQDAELSIALAFTTKFGIPCYRLYAVMNGKPRFLMERSAQDLQNLAAFISLRTGWPVR